MATIATQQMSEQKHNTSQWPNNTKPKNRYQSTSRSSESNNDGSLFSESADQSSESYNDGNLLSCANIDNNESDILLPDDANRNTRTELTGSSSHLIDYDPHVPSPSTNNNDSINPVERGTSLDQDLNEIECKCHQ